MAALSISQQPDPIHWMHHVTFREHRYRLLHHQCGTIGIFTVRLLQATQLRRSYWSPLALGPVKMFGLSKAHGPVSSFCEFTLDFVNHSDHACHSNNSSRTNRHDGNGGDRKPPARTNTTTTNRSNSSNNNNNNNPNKPMMVSPVIPNNDHPVWGDTCHFEFPLRKGAAPHDGMRVVLNVTVREDATAVEQMIPGMNHILHPHRMLGVGQIDLTELCFGENIITGQPLPGVRDAWIDLTLPRNQNDENDDENDSNSDCNNTGSHDHHQDMDRKRPAQNTTSTWHHSDHSDTKKDPLATLDSRDPTSNHNINNNNNSSNNNSNYGKVRVLVSYQPVGLEPQSKDIVAFESFARHYVRTTSCPPILDPLLPLTVLDRRGSFLLVEYRIMASSSSTTTTSARQQHEKVCVRVHRNAVFVIERQNIIDAATNLALLPVDVALSTPIGRATQRAMTPVVVASRELLMPALLSAKLVWLAARTTGLGVTHGLLALTGTLWHEGTTSLTSGGGGGDTTNSHHHRHSGSSSNIHRHDSNGGSSSHHPYRHGPTQDRRSNATAKFVQL